MCANWLSKVRSSRKIPLQYRAENTMAYVVGIQHVAPQHASPASCPNLRLVAGALQTVRTEAPRTELKSGHDCAIHSRLEQQ